LIAERFLDQNNSLERRNNMKPDTKNLLIGEKNGKYFTQLSETEFNTLVSILQINLGGLHYERSNELNKDTVDNIYKELVNITDYNPNSPYGAVITPSNTPRRKFIESLDKEEVITFLLKYGRLNREIEVTRQIVAEQKIWIELPESIDASAYKKEGFGRDGYPLPFL
jgi:hypothetical protein